MSNAIEVQNLYKYFPIKGGIFQKEINRVNVLNGIDITIPKNQITGLIGESGCGKSTLAKILIQLQAPSSGSFSIEGKPYTEWNDKKVFYKKIQMIFQDPYSSLNPRMKVKNIIGEMLTIHGATPEERDKRVLEMIHDVGLDNSALEKYPHEFSGGQRQRIAIARALAVNPEILIADEPVSALDLALQHKILLLLQDLQKKYNLTILMISHDLKTVAEICDSAIVMYLGRIVEVILGKDLLTKGKHPYLQALIDSIPISDPADRKKRRKLLEGEVPDPMNIPSGCPFHPRCGEVMDKCKEELPVLESVDGEVQRSACWLDKP